MTTVPGGDICLMVIWPADFLAEMGEVFPVGEHPHIHQLLDAGSLSLVHVLAGEGHRSFTANEIVSGHDDGATLAAARRVVRIQELHNRAQIICVQQGFVTD